MPGIVYKNTMGGVKIADKFGDRDKPSAEEKPGQRHNELRQQQRIHKISNLEKSPFRESLKTCCVGSKRTCEPRFTPVMLRFPAHILLRSLRFLGATYDLLFCVRL